MEPITPILTELRKGKRPSEGPRSCFVTTGLSYKGAKARQSKGDRIMSSLKEFLDKQVDSKESRIAKATAKRDEWIKAVDRLNDRIKG